MTSRSLSLLQFIVNRAKEPSTWAGLGVLCALAGNPLPALLPDVAVQLATGLAGALGILLRESKA